MSADARNSDGRHARPAWISEERMMQTSVTIVRGVFAGLYAGRLLDSAGSIDVRLLKPRSAGRTHPSEQRNAYQW